MRALGMLVIVSLITIACGVVLFTRPAGSPGSVGLSERGREFVKSQSADGTSSLRADRLDATPTSAGDRVYETACFRIRVMSNMNMQTVDVPGCRLVGKRDGASARVSMETHVGTLASDASVALRFRSSQYHEVEHTSTRRVYTSDHDATLFEQRGAVLLTISFSEITQESSSLVPDLMTLAEHTEML